MTDPNHPHTTSEKLIHAYDQMLERVRRALEEPTDGALPRLGQAIEQARQLAFEFDELTREEAEKIGDYIKRDIEAAANYLASPESDELANWLRFDIEQVEARILESFLSVADQTKLELLRLENEADLPATYHTGEITSIGTLVCGHCGKLHHFHQTGHIPPCSGCGNTLFAR
ncbi:MAG: hypothetical protein FD130_1221, partial [Halothiobacillaceae bacterium]